jgi:hypothetical protein
MVLLGMQENEKTSALDVLASITELWENGKISPTKLDKMAENISKAEELPGGTTFQEIFKYE